MQWNVDFEIASIVYQVVFLVFFLVKKRLPTRQNRLYAASLLSAFVCLLLDVSTAYLNSYSYLFSRAVLYGANMVYFITIIVMAVLFFNYVLALTNQYEFYKSSLYYVLMLPAVSSVFMTLTTPVTGFLFSIDETLHYSHGIGYSIALVSDSFYVIIAFTFVFAMRKRLPAPKRFSMYFACIPTVVGVLLQAVCFPTVLLVNAMTTLSFTVIYLSLENPDMYIDNSSGMFNGDAFKEMAYEAIKQGKPFSCIFLTISDYKNLDAVYGTENIDAATMEVVRYLRKMYFARNICRLQPWTFVIHESASGDYEEIVRALTGRFSKPFAGINAQLNFEPEIVVLPYWHMPSDVAGIESVYNFVMSKNGPHKPGTVIEVNERLIGRMEHERAVEHAIENAISMGSIQIYYQPIFSATEDRITSCEALARLFDENIGFISPEEFIKKAEETGSIGNLGTQIFEKVCLFIKEHKPEQYGVRHVHVNLSPMQFKQENLAKDLIELTDRYNLDRSMIVLEITETAAVEESLIIHGNMNRLISAGFTFSLDDYGTGFSNTASIIRLPFTSVKLDKSLIWAFFNRQSDILPDLISMFIHQKLELIAEGVETREMVHTLGSMNCVNMQGFYFAKPLPPREFMSYVWEFNRADNSKALIS
ncbi:MAG: EAL domain-containing protein [Lachnospiraceae bacterium]|nr:EAL domain-containing protein [Lachnospiraceae bacterium]